MNCMQVANLKSWLQGRSPEEVEVASLNLTISELALLHSLDNTQCNMPLINDRQFQTFMDHLKGKKKISFFERIHRLRREFVFSKVEQPDPDEELDKIAFRDFETGLALAKDQFTNFGPSVEIESYIQKQIESLSQCTGRIAEQLLNDYKAFFVTYTESLESNSPSISSYETLLPDFIYWNHRVETEEPNSQLIHDLNNEINRISTVYRDFLVPKMWSMVNRHSENPRQISYDYQKIKNFSDNVVSVAIEGMNVLRNRVHEQYQKQLSEVFVGVEPDTDVDENIPVGILLNDEAEREPLLLPKRRSLLLP